MTFRIDVVYTIIILLSIKYTFADDIERIFIVNGNVPVGINHISNYLTKTFEIKITRTTLPSSNQELSKLFKGQHDMGIETVFAYIPDDDFDMINKIAVENNIYVWNAVAYANSTCYSNIIFGYDISESSLQSILH